MQRIPLDTVPNQNVILTLEGVRYSLTLKESYSGGMLCTVVRENEELVSNIVCVFGTPILPYPYNEKGNFVFLTTNDDLPRWREFGANHFLFYLTSEEVEGLEND